MFLLDCSVFFFDELPLSRCRYCGLKRTVRSQFLCVLCYCAVYCWRSLDDGKRELLVLSQCYPDHVAAPYVVCLYAVVHVVLLPTLQVCKFRELVWECLLRSLELVESCFVQW